MSPFNASFPDPTKAPESNSIPKLSEDPTPINFDNIITFLEEKGKLQFGHHFRIFPEVF